jgi:hypothetical protein
MSDEKWIEALRKLNEADGAQLRHQSKPDRRTPACPSLPRLRRALLRQDWTSMEQEHRATSCLHCQKAEERMRRTIWHPSLAQLLAHARQQPGGLVDVSHHLDEEGCTDCRQVLALLERAAPLANGALVDGALLETWKQALSEADRRLVAQQETAASYYRPLGDVVDEEVENVLGPDGGVNGTKRAPGEPVPLASEAIGRLNESRGSGSH